VKFEVAAGTDADPSTTCFSLFSLPYISRCVIDILFMYSCSGAVFCLVKKTIRMTN
jgi:hypothetical protein